VKNAVKSEGTADMGAETIFQETCKECFDRSMYKTKRAEVWYATQYYKNCDVGYACSRKYFSSANC
jgi:hypothetical protein